MALLCSFPQGWFTCNCLPHPVQSGSVLLGPLSQVLVAACERQGQLSQVSHLLQVVSGKQGGDISLSSCHCIRNDGYGLLSHACILWAGSPAAPTLLSAADRGMVNSPALIPLGPALPCCTSEGWCQLCTALRHHVPRQHLRPWMFI